MSASGENEIERFLKKDSFKVVTPEEILNNTKSLNSHFLDDITDLYTDKAYEKSQLVIHAYNDEKKNSVLGYLSKIPRVSQGTSFYFATIIWDDDNDNIRFYLRDIMHAYVDIAFAIYHPKYNKKPKIIESAHNY